MTCPAITGRDSTVTPGQKLERRVPFFLGLVFYGFLSGAALIWIMQSGKVPLREALHVRSLPVTFSVGVGLGILGAWLSDRLVRRISWARSLEQEFGWVLGEQPKWQVVILALASGFAEELFFRGAMQPHLGIGITAAVFGLIHYPFHEKLRAWPFFSFVAGVGLGYEAQWTQSLLAPMLTHAVLNLINLWRITDTYRVFPQDLATP